MTEPGEAGARDFAVGFSRILRPFLIGLVVVGAIVGVLLYGANRPEDPRFRSAGADGEASPFTEQRIMIGERCLTVQVADTPEERAQGLRGRDDLGKFDGMLFVFEADSNAQFTMSGVKFPLTIGFYEGIAGSQVDAVDMEPCPDGKDCPTYGSKAPFRNALEVDRGDLPAGAYTGGCPA
jgi:uncharacterized membrane protein (UPF0127 family)